MKTITTVAVTGGTGKAGSGVIPELLNHGYTVLNLDRIRPMERLCPFLEVDLTDFGQTVDALHGCSAVVHLAAVPGPRMRPPEVSFRENILSTFNIFQAARILGLERVVWASSETTLGLPFKAVVPTVFPVDEAHYPFPESTYALSKVAGETIAQQFSRWSGRPHVALRFSNIMRGDDYQQFKGFQEDPMKRRANLWGYVDYRDVGQSCRLALEAELSGAHSFNIAAADTVMTTPNQQLLSVAYPGAKLDPGRGPHETLISIDRARKWLNYQPAHSWRDQ